MTRFQGRLFVVVPAYNEAAGITATLEALARQTDRDFDLIVVDNASTDGTGEVAMRFTSRSSRSSRSGRSGRLQRPLTVVEEPQKGTGSATDTGFREAIERGATHLARTDADGLPDPNWVAEIKRGFVEGLDMIAGAILPRTDEVPVPAWQRWVLLGAVEFAAFFGKVRPSNRHPENLGPYVMTPGSNMAIRADLYQWAGGFPRVSMEEAHEDRALVNQVRRLTSHYGLRRSVRVRTSLRRVNAWGLRNTLAWYADHKYDPEVVDVR